MQSIRIPDLIQKKRDHKELSSHEIDFFVKEMVQGRLEDSQLGKQNVLIFLDIQKCFSVIINSITTKTNATNKTF